MAQFHQEGKIAWVEGPGDLLVVSDLHGNLKDFLRITDIFEQTTDACLLFLGDLFHGPYLTESEWAPYVDVLGDFYYDQSAAVFRCLLELERQYPTRVKAILGNHEHAHVGGPRVSKFTTDESFSFESQLTIKERELLGDHLRRWPWMVGSRCGVAFTHGAPPATFFDSERLNQESLIVLDPQTWVQPGRAILSELLWRRYSPPEDVDQFLKHISPLCKVPQHIVIYGHEPSPEGYQIEHAHLFNLSSSFAMQHIKKTYLELSLSSTYTNSYEVERQIIPLFKDVNRSGSVGVSPPFSLDDDTLDEEV